MNRKKIPEDYYALAEKRTFKWLGPEVSNSHTKTWWECKLGHQWETRYGHIRQGHGCPICSIEKIADSHRKKPEDYHILATEYDFKWLGPEVSNGHIKTRWQCKFRHQWEACYSNIRRKHGCPICAVRKLADNLRKKPNDYYDLAENRGFRWLGPEVPNANTKTGWGCKCGRQWESHYNGIKQGKGCPCCAIKRVAEAKRLKPIAYHKLASKQNLKWLGPKVPNNYTKTQWECESGHIWETYYMVIQRGSSCPTCIDMVNGAIVSNSQRQLCEMLGGELNYPFGRKRIDVALLDGKIAIEYDSWYWHGYRQKEDAKRDKALLASGWKILHVKSNDKLPTLGQMKIALDLLRNGESITEIVLGDWGKGPTFKDAHSRASTVEQIGL